MTNLEWLREWLRSLSAEELVEFLRDNCHICIHRDYCVEGGYDCTKGKIKWLNKEHKEEIKPCPFCGGKPIVDKNQNSVYCADCHIGTPWTDSIEDAINTWNRRVDNAD